MIVELFEELFKPLDLENRMERLGGVKIRHNVWDVSGEIVDLTSRENHLYPILSIDKHNYYSTKMVSVDQVDVLSNRAYAMRRLAKEMEEMGVVWDSFYRLKSVGPVTSHWGGKAVSTGQQMVGFYDDKFLIMIETKLFVSGGSQGYYVVFTDKNKSKTDIAKDGRDFKSRGYMMNYLDSKIYRYERSKGNA